MAALDRTRWQSLEPLLDHALDLSPEDRREWLDTLSRESPTIAADLSSLLESDAAADERGFLSGTLATTYILIELGEVGSRGRAPPLHSRR
ncbi:MAG TPA: hypothetical protein VFR95_03880 [Gemmatimonadaceae bacterium]|nr:hypothetical protein [Gemmatimonadaceae bacterium]